MQRQREAGKTAVLVERIIEKIIYDKVDIDKILVVTFTSSAASEMRERILDAIYKKLEENPEDENLQRQIVLLNKSNICTIDSFCLDVIRNNFFEIDVSANARVADGTEILLLKQEILDDLFEEKYVSEDADFISLINTYTHYNKDEELKDLILKIYSYIQASPFPEDWLEESIAKLKVDRNENFSETQWGKFIISKVNENLENGILKLKNIKNKIDIFQDMDKYSNILSMDIAGICEVKNSLSDWNKACEKLGALNFKTWPADKKITNEYKDEAKEIRNSVKEEIKKIKSLLITDSKEANEEILYMHDILEKLKNLILEFSKKFYDAKREKNIMDFNDMEHLALNILVKKDENGNIIKTEVAKKYEEKFEEIAIDEYQDSNLVQEYILTSISTGNNIFMVGDVKQSIYKFRQARPQLFLEKYNTYLLDPNEKEDRKIKLFKNFRSRRNILDFTNLVFENLMSEELGEINYDIEEYLNLGANYPEIEQNLITEAYVIETSEEEVSAWKNEEEVTEESDDKPEDVVLEARFVAQKIKELMESKFEVSNKDGSTRDIMYRDIAILLRSTSGTAGIYEKELSDFGIPVYSENSGEYLQSTEIETIMALLKIINNPMQDIPLVTVMRSPIGNFTDNELLEIRLKDRNSNFYEALEKSKEIKKVENFLNMLEELRKDEEYMALDEWIWNIYVKTGYMNYVSLMPNGAIRLQNLKMLFERAKQYESASFKGLFNFINFIDKIKFNSEDLSAAKLIGENENVVRIMTIHKSKGLEFPVVILGGFGKQFNFKDLNEPILLDQDLGFGPQYINDDLKIEFPTLAKKALGLKAKDEVISEEMRVLYVALTRPKEKLIIVGRQKEANKKMQEKLKLLEAYKSKGKINSYIVGKYKTYLDWLELIYIKEGVENTKNIFSLDVINKNSIVKKQIEADIQKDFGAELNKKENVEYKKQVAEIIKWQYKFKDIINLPSKTSVTKIKEMQNIMEINEQTKKIDIEIAEKNDVNVLTEAPKFLSNIKNQKVSNTRKGTLMHLCIQKMNEKVQYNEDNLEVLIDELVRKNIISEEEAKAIDKEKILEYTKSNLWLELSNAKEIHKEQPFYINIKASSIYGTTGEDEEILVQGVIDLYFINEKDELILVDYKTDYVDNEQKLVEKYKKQLELYKVALEQACSRKVEKIEIYSLYLNKEIFI